MLSDRGAATYASTVAKIEAGDRMISIVELDIFADILGVSVDALLDRSSSRKTDLAWAASKLASNAQRLVSDVNDVYRRLSDDMQDVYDHCRGNTASGLLGAAQAALTAIAVAGDALTEVGEQFPLPR